MGVGRFALSCLLWKSLQSKRNHQRQRVKQTFARVYAQMARAYPVKPCTNLGKFAILASFTAEA